MSSRQELIKQLLEMQKQFVAYEHSLKDGFDMSDYYVKDPTHPLYQYRERYNDIAMQLVDQAHTERGSKR